MARIHTTDIYKLTLNRLKNCEQRVYQYKPSGLWYGIDDSWINFCKNNCKEKIQPLKFEIEIDLEKIFIMKDNYDLASFLTGYGNQFYHSMDSFIINWREVSKIYSGIEIPNYSLIKNEYLFRGWDCASGCIWDKDAILAITKI